MASSLHSNSQRVPNTMTPTEIDIEAETLLNEPNSSLTIANTPNCSHRRWYRSPIHPSIFITFIMVLLLGTAVGWLLCMVTLSMNPTLPSSNVTTIPFGQAALSCTNISRTTTVSTTASQVCNFSQSACIPCTAAGGSQCENDSSFGKVGAQTFLPQYRSLFPPLTNNLTCAESMTYVTAANHKYFNAVRNLIGSFHHNLYNGSCDSSVRFGHRIVVWDVGLTNTQRQQLTQLCHIDLHVFNFSHYPPYVADLHTYAFKPLLIRRTFEQYPSACIFYLDSGEVLEGNWAILHDDVLPDIDENGLWVGSSHWIFPNTKYTHPSVFEYFNLSWANFPPPTSGRNQTRNFNRRSIEYDSPSHQWPPLEMLHFHEVQAGLIAFKRFSLMSQLLHDWAECAMVRACISPLTADRTNNRQDQTALNFLIYRPPNGYYYQWLRQILPNLSPRQQWRARTLSRCQPQNQWPNEVDLLPPPGFNVHCNQYYEKQTIRTNRLKLPFAFHQYILTKPQP